MRTVVRETSFDEGCEVIFGTAQRGDEILRAVDWAVARRAEAFPTLVGDFRTIRTDEFPGAPPCIITFRISGDYVMLVDIVQTNTEDEP